jgi:glycosyltransferase involved in cell wall biosynthesis
LSRALRTAGFDTTLIHGRLGLREGDMTSFLPTDGISVVQIADLVRPVSPIRDLRAMWRIYREFCRWKPQIIHTHMAKAGALGRIAGLMYNVTSGWRHPARLIHTYHGHVFEGYFDDSSTRLFLAVERMLGRKTDALVAISEHIRQDLLRTYSIATEARVQLIALGFNLDRLTAITAGDRAAARQTLGMPDTTVVVTTVGRLTAIKEQALFVEMAGRLVARGKDVTCLIVGDGELRADLEARAQKLDLRERLRFLGWRGDLDTIYGATDVFVLTSRNEGTPVALIEAMAAGLPAVSTDVGGVRDVITDNGLGVLVPFGDVERLSGAVASFCDAPGRRSEVGERARRSVTQRFGVERLVEDIGRLYWQVLENGGTIR